jgi:phospholipid/cholesterol/gamma-HCH transport system substrate-binding protein
MNMKAHCAEPASQSNARGAQHAPQRAGAAYRAPVVASYNADTRRLHWYDGYQGADSQPESWTPPAGFGGESWQWLLIRPLAR